MSSEYGVEGNALVKRRSAGDKALLFRAEGVRQERTGVHARVSVACNGAILAWSNFNIEKDEDRVRLTNSVYSHFEQRNGSGKAEGLPGYPKTYLKSDLDQFCAGLWDAQLQQTMPEMMAGSMERAEPAFLIRPYVLEGGGTILFAPPGRGKSYLLMLMAVSMDAGVRALWQVRKTPCLFINLERSARSVADRLGNVNAVLNQPRERKLATINARGKSLVDVAAAAQRYIEENGVGCVFVDSISRAGAGDLTANDSTNRIIDQLNRFGCAWFGLAHTPRADETHLYGSIHFEAGADLVVQLLSEQEETGPLGIGLQLTKKNDVGNWPLQVMALEFDEAGLLDVRDARRGEFPDIESKRKMTMREAIRQHLLDVGTQSATEIAEATGFNRSNISSLLQKDTETFVRSGIRPGKHGQSVAYGVREGA